MRPARWAGIAVAVAITRRSRGHRPALPAQAAERPIGHVFVINLENQGFDVTWGASSPAPYLSRHPACSRGLPEPVLRDRAPEPPELRRPDQRAGPEPRDPGRLREVHRLRRDRDRRLRPGARQRVRVPRNRADDRRSAHREGPDLEVVPGRHRELVDRRHHVPAPARSASSTRPAAARPGDQYTTRHNPFMYFHSIIDCAIVREERRRPRRVRPATCASARRPPATRTSPRTSATAVTTIPASTATLVASCEPTRGCARGCPRS